MTRSSFHSKFQKTGQNTATRTVSFSVSDWEAEFKNKESFGTQIGLLFRKSGDVSSKSADKIFGSFEEKDKAREFLVQKLFALEPKIIQHSCEFSPECFCNLMGSYARLRVFPTHKMMNDYINPMMRKILPEMESVHLRYFVDFLVDLAIYPGDDVMTDWCGEARSKGREFGVDGTYAVLQKMAILDLLRQNQGESADSSPLAKLARGILRSVAPVYDPLNKDNKVDRSLYQAGLWFDLHFFKHFEIETETHLTSKKEIRFSNLLKRANISQAQNDMVIPAIDHKIDITVEYDGSLIGCEFDGSYHFVEDRENDRLLYNGQSRFQTWLINELMPEDTQLFRVPDAVMKRHHNPQSWKGIFNLVASQGAGAYILHAHDDIREACAPDAWVVCPR